MSRVGNSFLLASKANLQAAGGRRGGGLCYYNFTKLLQLLEAVLRLFVRSQDELRAERGQHLEREERARDATTFYLNTSL